MAVKPLTCILLGLSIGLTASPAIAAKRHKHRPHWSYGPVVTQPAPRLQEPHMIQVKPGYWISSWGCVTDEGGGRIKPCEVGTGGGWN